MEKRTIARLSASAVCVGLVTMGLTGVFTGGGNLFWQQSSADQRIQDGTYYAQKENQFSTVQVEMGFREHRIIDCVIHSFGSADLMTDDIRREWASAIVESQSAAPDAITGATLTFSAASVQEAVEDIMAQAVGEKERVEAFQTEDATTEETAAETQETAAASASEQMAETAAQEAPAAATDVQPKETEQTEEAAQAPSTDGSRLMRQRPVMTVVETPAETASEATAITEQAPSTDGSRLMRQKPALTVVETTAEIPSEATAATEQAPSTDGSRLMRQRPVMTVVETPAETSLEAPAVTEQAPSTDGSRLMRQRPVVTVVETPAENMDRFMRERPSL